DVDRRPYRPRRRPRRGARRQALAQTRHDARDVRIGGRLRQPDGGTLNNGIGMIINGLIAILLVLTIGYCMRLNRRLKLLKSDEQSLRATIAELVTATDIAERAITGLKLTVEECEVGLAARLASGERLTVDLDRRIAAAKNVVGRLVQAAANEGPRAERPD